MYYDGIISKDTILSKKKKKKNNQEQNSIYSIPPEACICILKRGESEACGRGGKNIHHCTEYVWSDAKETEHLLPRERKPSRETGREREFY